MQTQTRALFKNNYEGVSANKLVESGKIPDKNNPFRGLYSETIEMGKNDNNGFFIHFFAPKDACATILTTYWGPKGVFVAATIHQGETKLHTFSYTGGTYPPPDTATALAACTGGDKDMYLWFK